MWRNWYTRWSQKPMALPCEFESHHLHSKDYPKTTHKEGALGSLFPYITRNVPALYPLFTYSLGSQKVSQNPFNSTKKSESKVS